MLKLCPYCHSPVKGKLSSRVFCTERCRRKWQDKRRMEERRRARIEREGGLFDPWAASDLDDWDADAILANALLDPDPMSAEAEFLQGRLSLRGQ